MPKHEWSRLRWGPRQDWAQFQQTHATPVGACKSLCFTVRAGGELRALAPAFVLEKDCQQDSWQWLRRLYQPRMLVLGSPLAEACPLGLAVGTSAAQQRDLLNALVRCADAYSRQQHCDILIVKHADDATDELWTRACVPVHLRRLTDQSMLGYALCGRNVQQTSNWVRCRVSWLRWSESLFDSVLED